MKKYVIVSDDDGHKFIILADKINDWYRFLDRLNASHWYDGFPDYVHDWDGNFPDYVIEKYIGSFSNVTFDEYDLN